MKLQFPSVALIGKYHNTTPSNSPLSPRLVLQDLAHFLHHLGCEVVVERNTANNTGVMGDAVHDVAGIGRHCDLGLVVGGDGTMLGIGRQLAPFGVPLIGINQGRLGFITDIPLERYPEVLTRMLHGEFEEDCRGLMQGQVLRDGRGVYDAVAMNDVVLNRGATAGMVALRIEVDGHFVANQLADGLIIATPTGSTAYALSAGGPMLHPRLSGWVMVPIAPHTLSNRPIVLPSNSEVTIELLSGRDASANFDMQSLATLMQGDRVVVKQSEHQVRFLHPLGWNYFETLRNKLHWNEGAV
jgi:NAD+ kinase